MFQNTRLISNFEQNFDDEKSEEIRSNQEYIFTHSYK
jgi:hypothetical protein